VRPARTRVQTLKKDSAPHAVASQSGLGGRATETKACGNKSFLCRFVAHVKTIAKSERPIRLGVVPAQSGGVVGLPEPSHRKNNPFFVLLPRARGRC